MDALRDIRADNLFDIVGGTIARLPTLNVNYRAERARERAAAPGIETGISESLPGDRGR